MSIFFTLFFCDTTHHFSGEINLGLSIVLDSELGILSTQSIRRPARSFSTVEHLVSICLLVLWEWRLYP